MRTLEITDERALAAWTAADDNGKKSFEALFPELFANVKTDTGPIMARVKSFDDILSIRKITMEQITSNIDSPDEIAYKKLKLIVEVLNEGWKPNWKDDDERKYYPWFDFSGSSLSFGGCGYDYSDSRVGSRLCFKSSDLAEFAGTLFLNIYSDFMTF